MGRTGMAGLLGKAAASNWKRATFGENRAGGAAVDWRSLSLDIRQQRLAQQLSDAAAPATEDAAPEACGPTANRPDLASSTGGLAERRYNPDKQRLSSLGGGDPGAVGRSLLQELSGRLGVDGVFASVEHAIRKQGPAQKLGNRDARRITRTLNRTLMNGASKQVRPQHTPPASRTNWACYKRLTATRGSQVIVQTHPLGGTPCDGPVPRELAARAARCAGHAAPHGQTQAGHAPRHEPREPRLGHRHRGGHVPRRFRRLEVLYRSLRDGTPHSCGRRRPARGAERDELQRRGRLAALWRPDEHEGRVRVTPTVCACRHHLDLSRLPVVTMSACLHALPRCADDNAMRAAAAAAV